MSEIFDFGVMRTALYLVQRHYKVLTMEALSLKGRHLRLANMKSVLSAVLLGFLVLASAPATVFFGEAAAYAENRFNLQKTLRRLKANPKYSGRVLGTRVVQTTNGELVEVRILKPNDRVIIVYIDPQTGGVVGDSGF